LGYLVWPDADQFIFTKIFCSKRRKIINYPDLFKKRSLRKLRLFLKVHSKKSVNFCQSFIVFCKEYVTESIPVPDFTADDGVDVLPPAEIHKIPTICSTVDVGQC